MTLPPDTIQRVREAMVAALDAHPDIVSITGRPTGNVVPYKNRDAAVKPVVAYLVVVATPTGGAGDNWQVTVQFSALAEDDDDETANALLHVVDSTINPVTLFALVPPLDAYVMARSRRGLGEDLSARADLDITLFVTT